jgi:hypothetical protein
VSAVAQDDTTIEQRRHGVAGDDGLASQQEWEGSVNRHQPPPSPDEGPARTGTHHPVTSAEQAAPGTPPNRPAQRPGRRGTSRKQPAPTLFDVA